MPFFLWMQNTTLVCAVGDLYPVDCVQLPVATFASLTPEVKVQTTMLRFGSFSLLEDSSSLLTWGLTGSTRVQF